MRGPGAMLAVRLSGRLRRGFARDLRRSRVFTHAVSLGGVDSLIQHPAALTHRPVPADARPDADVVRLSIGLEDPADLIADLDRALLLYRRRARRQPTYLAARPRRTPLYARHAVLTYCHSYPAACRARARKEPGVVAEVTGE